MPDDSIEQKKLNLEVEKLEAEISELRRPWYTKMSVITPISSLLVAIFAILYGYFSGLFNNQSLYLENKKHDLQNEIIFFEKQKDSLKNSIAFNQKIATFTRDSLLILKGEIRQADSTMKKLDIENLSFKNKIRWNEKLLKTKDSAIRYAHSAVIRFVTGHILNNNRPVSNTLVFALAGDFVENHFATKTDRNGFFSLPVTGLTVYGDVITVCAYDSVGSHIAHCFDVPAINPQTIDLNIDRSTIVYDTAVNRKLSEGFEKFLKKH